MRLVLLNILYIKIKKGGSKEMKSQDSFRRPLFYFGSERG
jgi:hypothetical protein